MRNLEKFSGNVISKNEMKSVNGGLAPGTCAFQGENGDVITGVSKTNAQAGAAQFGGHWCCDSCGSASWMPQA